MRASRSDDMPDASGFETVIVAAESGTVTSTEARTTGRMAIESLLRMLGGYHRFAFRAFRLPSRHRDLRSDDSVCLRGITFCLRRITFCLRTIPFAFAASRFAFGRFRLRSRH